MKWETYLYCVYSKIYLHYLHFFLKMALAKKPEVFFDVIVVTPETIDTKNNEQPSKEIKFFAEKIVEQIKNSGVSADMVRITFKRNKIAKSNEVQIFVQ